MNFFLLGLNHRTSPLEVREKLTLSPGDIEEFFLKKREELPSKELLALSTCNRTELYGAHDKCREIKEDLKGILLNHKSLDKNKVPENIFYYAEDDEAVRHLFKVASGIDSMVVGEAQILGQVKDAYSISTKIGSNGPMINKIFHHAFRVGKRARTETKVGHGIVSVSHAAVELSKKIFQDLKDKSVLLVGAGETGELALQHFLKGGIRKIWISNRSIEKAKEVSKRLKGSVVPFGQFKEMLANVDIAIFSTASENYLLEEKDCPNIFSEGRVAPLFLIDISVPRNVDPNVSRAENVFLYDIDDLKGIVKENIKARESEIKKVEAIIKEEITRYRNWIANLQFEPLLKFLKQEFESIRNDEFKKHLKKFEGNADDVEALTRLIVNKIVNRPLQKLKNFDINSYAYVLRSSLLEELFRKEDE